MVCAIVEVNAVVGSGKDRSKVFIANALFRLVRQRKDGW